MSKPKHRTEKTYQNKVREITRYYNRRVKMSKRAKEKGIIRGSYFHEGYPKLNIFLDKNPIKQASK